MKIARFAADGRTAFGIVESDQVQVLAGVPWESLTLTGEALPLAAVKLLAPVEPPDVFAIGLNYKPHAEESGFQTPAAPVVFLKAGSSVIGPDESVVLPAMAPDEVDYEAELVVVIGRACAPGRSG